MVNKPNHPFSGAFAVSFRECKNMESPMLFPYYFDPSCPSIAGFKRASNVCSTWKKIKDEEKRFISTPSFYTPQSLT